MTDGMTTFQFGAADDAGYKPDVMFQEPGFGGLVPPPTSPDEAAVELYDSSSSDSVPVLSLKRFHDAKYRTKRTLAEMMEDSSSGSSDADEILARRWRNGVPMLVYVPVGDFEDSDSFDFLSDLKYDCSDHQIKVRRGHKRSGRKAVVGDWEMIVGGQCTPHSSELHDW